MKFFDYKFLILLGLTLVVYFIYREVEYLREKIDKIEHVTKLRMIEQMEPKLNDVHPVQSNVMLTNMVQQTSPVQSNVMPTNVMPNRPSPKIISVNLTTGTDNNAGIQMIQQKINDIIEHSDTESNSDSVLDTTLSESSKHLAIYSNDNDQFESTQNSLMESVEANKNDLKFEYDKMENIPDLKNMMETMETIMNNLSSEANNEPENNLSVNEITEEKQLDQIIIKPNTPSNNQTDDNNLDIEIKSKELDIKSLNAMKLPEIKKVAEQNKINITKKTNGQQKLKTKNELITEILNKINK